MNEDVRGEVHAFRNIRNSKEVAIKVFVGRTGKVIRFPTDEDFTIGEPVFVRLVRAVG